MRGQVVGDNVGHVRGDKGQDNPLVEGCPLSAVSPEGYEVIWSAALYRAGVAPGLSSMETESPIATAMRTRLGPADSPSRPSRTRRTAKRAGRGQSGARTGSDHDFRSGFASDKQSYVNGAASTTYGDFE